MQLYGFLNCGPDGETHCDIIVILVFTDAVGIADLGPLSQTNPAAYQAAIQLCLCLQLLSLNPQWRSQEKVPILSIVLLESRRDGHTRRKPETHPVA